MIIIAQTPLFRLLRLCAGVILMLSFLWATGCERDIGSRSDGVAKRPVEVAGEDVPDLPAPDESTSVGEYSLDTYSSPGSEKVAANLRAVIAEMTAHGITRQNASTRGASDFSNPLVRVDAQGNIQTYIHVDAVGTENRRMLESYEVAVEIVNEKLNIYQAWIPFNRIMEVVQLSFVKRITPPSYAVTW
ncbi:MAG: hypothetical protein JRF72_04845 [Deltaproteobacteria bacterium]|nr:hypothetical protein [Deltaproteobacteria bacterium]